jgi:hypothetical protein
MFAYSVAVRSKFVFPQQFFSFFFFLFAAGLLMVMSELAYFNSSASSLNVSFNATEVLSHNIFKRSLNK